MTNNTTLSNLDSFTYICNNTQKSCKFCKDYEFRISCYDHENIETTEADIKKILIRKSIDLLQHVHMCDDLKCPSANCQRLKQFTPNSNEIKFVINNDYFFSAQLIALCYYHMYDCTNNDCTIVLCHIMKKWRMMRAKKRQQQTNINNNLTESGSGDKNNSTQFNNQTSSSSEYMLQLVIKLKYDDGMQNKRCKPPAIIKRRIPKIMPSKKRPKIEPNEVQNLKRIDNKSGENSGQLNQTGHVANNVTIDMETTIKKKKIIPLVFTGNFKKLIDIVDKKTYNDNVGLLIHKVFINLNSEDRRSLYYNIFKVQNIIESRTVPIQIKQRTISQIKKIPLLHKLYKNIFKSENKQKQITRYIKTMIDQLAADEMSLSTVTTTTNTKTTTTNVTTIADINCVTSSISVIHCVLTSSIQPKLL